MLKKTVFILVLCTSFTASAQLIRGPKQDYSGGSAIGTGGSAIGSGGSSGSGSSNPTPPATGSSSNCCLSLPNNGGFNCAQWAAPAPWPQAPNTQAPNPFNVSPQFANSAAYLVPFGQQQNACNNSGGKCHWNCDLPQFAAVPPKDACLSSGGVYCNNNPAQNNGECMYGTSQVYLLSGGNIGQLNPVVPCSMPGSCNPAPSGSCNKPGGLGSGTYISCGFVNGGIPAGGIAPNGMKTGYYCH